MLVLMTKFPLSAAVAQKSKTHYDGSAKVWYAKFVFSTHSSLPSSLGVARDSSRE